LFSQQPILIFPQSDFFGSIGKVGGEEEILYDQSNFIADKIIEA
jgi:hypothetical protein